MKFSREHEWVKIDGNIATIGITDYAQSNLGDIVYIETEEVVMGETIQTDSVFGSIEAVKTVSDLFAPMSGELIERNELLEDRPELVNEDPYGEGWIIKLQISDISEYENLLTEEQYKDLIN